ncbi:MAG: hypothetical protein R2684_12935 [Pyrinomonadaceae bacterium]
MKNLLRKGNLGSTILIILIAVIASQSIYWLLMVPRLPNLSPDSTWPWWLAVLSPYGLASLFIGFRLKGFFEIPIAGIVAALSFDIGRLLFLWISGKPPGHDLWWTEVLTVESLIERIPFVVFIGLIFSLAIALGFVLHLISARLDSRSGSVKLPSLSDR